MTQAATIFPPGLRMGGTSYSSASRVDGSEIWTMLADGTEQHPLTQSGNNSMPNWSWK